MTGDTGPAPPERGRRLRHGAAILPTLFTTGNLFLGFWSIIQSLDGRAGDANHFSYAALLIGGAAILDMLDGRIARLTGTQSEFGAELDSLADTVSFGVAPALLAYVWALAAVPRAGWPAAFLFLVCGVIRLARFNVQRQVTDARYFVGLAIPAGAMQIAVIVFAFPEPISDRWQQLGLLGLVVALAFLMVSTFRYRSFKGIDLRRRRSYMTVLGIALLFFLIKIHPEATLLSMVSLYTVSGPLGWAVGALRRRREAPPAPLPVEAAPPAQ